MIELRIENVRLGNYLFNFNNRFNILRDKSGTGKSKLIDAVTSCINEDEGSSLKCSVPIHLYSSDEKQADIVRSSFISWREDLIIIDEASLFFKIPKYNKIMFDCNCVFLIICREKRFESIPLHRDSIFKFELSDNFHVAVLMYASPSREGYPQLIITEDSKSDYQFIVNLLYNVKVCSAGEILRKRVQGAAMLVKALKRSYKNGCQDIAIVYGKSGIGQRYDGIAITKNECPNLNLWELNWESFEWYLLHLKFLYSIAKKNMLTTFESVNSIERYASSLLKEVLRCETHSVDYNKSELPRCFRPLGCYSCAENARCVLKHKSGDLLDNELLELFRRIPPEDCINWCRQNASPLFDNLSDRDLLERMLPVYLEN